MTPEITYDPSTGEVQVDRNTAGYVTHNDRRWVATALNGIWSEWFDSQGEAAAFVVGRHVARVGSAGLRSGEVEGV